MKPQLPCSISAWVSGPSSSKRPATSGILVGRDKFLEMFPENSSSKALLILEYHRVAHDGPEALRPWRITPEAFARHLQSIRDTGLRVMTFDSWLGDSNSDRAGSSASPA